MSKNILELENHYHKINQNIDSIEYIFKHEFEKHLDTCLNGNEQLNICFAKFLKDFPTIVRKHARSFTNRIVGSKEK